MHSHLYPLLIAGLISSSALPAAEEARPTPISTERFARSPLLSNVRLSPDGTRLAGLMAVGKDTALITQRIDGSDLRTILREGEQGLSILWIGWVNRERLLVSVGYGRMRRGIPVTETRLVAIGHDGGERLDLSDVGNSGRKDKQQIQDKVVDWLPEDGRHVLLQLNTGSADYPGVFRVNIESGERKIVQTPERLVRSWLTDAQHRVRIGIRENDGQFEVLHRAPEGGPWRTLWSYGLLSGDEVEPLGFDTNPDILFIAAPYEGRKAVFSVDLRDPQLTRRLHLAHREQDLEGHLFRSPISGEIVGFQGNGSGGAALTAFWDPELDDLSRQIDAALPRRHNALMALSRDELRYLIHSSGNGIPGQFYLGDRKTGRLTLVADQFGHLDKTQMVGKERRQISARDGTLLDAWLTRPRHRTSGPQPMVLLPHGGPQSRDNDDFDLWTEFLANRGYTVLQVNFRGSSGYGQAFKLAGLQRWGLEMQDDLSDAAEWAIGQGIADPARICIVGGSYGGYAALMGAIKTPALYRCAASINGVTDLEAIIHHDRQYAGGAAAVRAQIGDFWRDSTRLRATSPVYHAAQIQAPVLLIHGSGDMVVPVSQGRMMTAALKQAGKPHRYLEILGANHSLSAPDHRLAFFQALEEFLARHLEGEARHSPGPLALPPGGLAPR